MNERKFFTGNQLKLFAALVMTVDHIGVYLFPDLDILRIIGRLAFPIFAYMIAEGCVFTRNRPIYFLRMAGWATVFQIVYFIVTGSLYQCIFVTFALSVGLCIVLDKARCRESALRWLLFAGAVAVVYGITEGLPLMLDGTDFSVDYGFWGVMLPVAVFAAKDKWDKLMIFAMGLVILALGYDYKQMFSLAAVPLIALYNGQRGRLKLKNFFYVFYPLHLVVIYLTGMFLG